MNKIQVKIQINNVFKENHGSSIFNYLTFNFGESINLNTHHHIVFHLVS